MSITYREFRTGDLQQIANLTEIAMPRDVVSAKRFAQEVLLDVNFAPNGLIVATDDHKIIGFIYATRAEKGVPSQPHMGYITIGCVHPDYQRQGIGTQLISRAMNHLRERGASHITVAGYPQGYFFPGVDESTYPHVVPLLERHGFERAGEAAAMHIDLDAYITPPAAQNLIARRQEEGYTFSTANWDDLPELISFASERLAPDWGEILRAAALQGTQGGDRVLFSREPNGSIVGFATYGAVGEIVDRFGPFGVDENYRGTGLGRVLLHATLTRMRAENAHGAWFLWTGEDSPAGHLYLSSGFEVVRRFTVLRASL